MIGKKEPDKKRNEMYVGSLFSGIGGIELGFKRAGFKTRWFIEKDKYAQTIIHKHWGQDALIYEDITTVDFNTVPKVDILTGGFPCQDISNAGKRVGITGSRSSLWKYYKEAIRILRPQFALIENVPALTRRGLDVVLSDLAEIGYDAEWYNLSASAIGANHQRDRVFIIAYTESILQKRTVKKRDIIGKSKKEIRNGSLHDAHSESFGMWKQGVLQRNSSGFIETESRICGVAHGIPFRVDRIRCLGNAVVPQVAEVFAQAINQVILNEL